MRHRVIENSHTAEPRHSTLANNDWTGREVILVTLASLVFGFVFSYPILSRLRNSAVIWDWDFIEVLAWVPWKTVVTFHQFPIWNPYLCGGIPLLGDPQSSYLTPFFLIHLIFGPIIGLHLEIPLHVAVGWAGGYVLARVLRLGTFGAVTCATIFPASSWFYLHAAAGHHIFFTSTYWPWVLAFTLIAIERRRVFWATLPALVIVLIFFEGAPYQVSYMILILGAVLVPSAVIRRDPWPLIILVANLGFTYGLAAIKIFPASALLGQHLRPGYTPEHVVVSDVLQALFDRYQDINHRGIADWAFFEGGAYLSPLFVLLVVAGAIWRARETWPWILAALIFLSLAMGIFAPWAPFALLRHLPIYSSERVAIRMLVPFILCSGVIAAYGVDYFAQRSLLTIALVGTLLLLGTIDSFMMGPHNLAYITTYGETPIEPSKDFRQFRNPIDTEFTQRTLRFNQANIGMLYCYEFAEIPTNAIGYNQPDYLGEQHLMAPGDLKLLDWRPNTLTFEVNTEVPNTILVNQNIDEGWRLVRGKGELMSYDGLLAIALPAGHQEIKVRNIGDGVIDGIVLTIATTVLALLLWHNDW